MGVCDSLGTNTLQIFPPGNVILISVLISCGGETGLAAIAAGDAGP